MHFKFVICEVVLTVFGISGIYGGFEINNERFSRIRYLISSENDISPDYKKPTFQWDPKPIQKLAPVMSTTAKTAEYTQSKSVSLKKNNKRRRKLMRHKKDMENLRYSNSTLELLNQTAGTNVTSIAKQKRRKNRKRKRKKQRRLKNKQDNNILEITTARNLNSSGTFPRNLTLDDLIKKLNENPEVNLNILNRDLFFNKTLTYHEESPSAPTKGNRLINLQVDMGPRKKYNRRSRCRFDNGGCSQICRPKGPNKCSCMKGYVLDRDTRTCIDVDECKTNNGGCQSTCENSFGSFECSCSNGFRLGDDRKSCEDVNECLSNNGHGLCDDVCHNTHGTYACSCRNGTVLGEDGKSCVDVDECADGTSGCSHVCINTRGGAFCACPDGLQLSSDWKTCEDINECDDKSVLKSCNGSCINTEGSYRCRESPDFQNDQVFKIRPCKPIFPPAHGYVKCSRKGAIKVFGRNGRRRVINSPGTECRLFCPEGHAMSGMYRVTCGFNGQWEGSTNGLCKPSDPLVLECPSDQNFTLPKEADSIIVRFPAPTTNFNWRYVKSVPKWAKRLIGRLTEGPHLVRFDATDPTTKINTFCHFKINVGKYNA